MNYRMIRYLLGVILTIEAALLLLPMLTAWIFGESVLPFLFTILILMVFAVPSILFKPANTRIYAKEGFLCVAMSWILMSAFGALPFVFSGAIPNYVDALFETVSGFTTTGSTILFSIETLPKGVLLWRSLTHWIGGMGVLVFLLAILPSSGGQTIHLLRAEVPGPTKGKLVPKLRQTALILYGIYIAMTIVEMLALLCTGMPFYDSIVNAFGTAGTGGFAVLNDSIAGYHNPAAEWIIAVFMLLFSLNFNMYYFLLVRRVRDVAKNGELRGYLLICACATAVICANTFKLFSTFGDCIRASFFQVMSISSTSGFSTVDFNEWPALSKAVLTVLMIVGGCAGSTAGGLKFSRVIILAKSIVREIRQMIRPRSVHVVRMDGEVLPDETVNSANRYLTVYLAIFIVSAFLITVDNFDAETNITAVIACLNNVGPGFGKVGPSGTFGIYSYFSKIILSLDMLFGRLEILPMVILFSPSAWRKR